MRNEHLAFGHLVTPRRGCKLLAPVELKPEGLPLIKAAQLTRSPKRFRKVHFPVLLRAAAGVAGIYLFPTAEVQSAGLPETLLLSLSPRSCRTYVPASQSNLRLAHMRVSGDAPRASQQSNGNVEGIASLTALSRCFAGRWKVAHCFAGTPRLRRALCSQLSPSVS